MVRVYVCVCVYMWLIAILEHQDSAYVKGRVLQAYWNARMVRALG